MVDRLILRLHNTGRTSRVTGIIGGRAVHSQLEESHRLTGLFPDTDSLTSPPLGGWAWLDRSARP